MACTEFILETVLIAFSLITLVLGLSVTSLGVVTCFASNLTEIEPIKPFIQDFSTLGNLSYILIAVGLVISIVSFYGCCGAINNDSKMLSTYALFHSILLICFVFVIFYYPAIKNLNVKKLENAIADEFSDYQKYRGVIDPFQKNYECCGFKGQADYTGMHSLPYSCCPGIDQVEKSNCTSSKAFNKSCKVIIQEFLAKLPSVFHSDKIIEYIIFGTVITETIIIVFSMYLARQ